jgi:hypothetical protein
MLALVVQPLSTRAADVRVINYQDAPLVVQQCAIDSSGAQPILHTTFNVAGSKDVSVARFRYQFFDGGGHVVADARPEQAGTYTTAKSYTLSAPSLTAPPPYEQVECAPVYAQLSDGTTWFAPNQTTNAVGVLPLVLGGAAVAAGIAVAASSSSSSSSPAPTPPPTPTPSPRPTPSPTPTESPTPTPTSTPTATPAPGELTVTPPLLKFKNPSSAAQSFTVSGGTKPYTIDPQMCASFARVTGTSPGPYTVAPKKSVTAGGTCVIGVHSKDGRHATVAVVVFASPLVVTPHSLTFADPHAPAQHESAHGAEPPYVVHPETCSGVATITGMSPGPYTVKPVATNGAGGNCAFEISSKDGQHETVAVSVAHSKLVVTPEMLTFASPSAPAQSVTAKGAVKPYHVDLGRCPFLTATPKSGAGPFSIGPDGSDAGACVATIRSSDGQSENVSVVVSATPLTVTPEVLTFKSPAESPKSFTASGAIAPYTASPDKCGGIATVSGKSPTFTVTPVASSSGGTCAVHVHSADGQERTVIVIVEVVEPPPNELKVAPELLKFTSPSEASRTFAVSGGTPPYAVTSPDCTGIATFTPASLAASGDVTVTPVSANDCSIRVDDSSKVKQSRSVAVVIAPVPFTVTPVLLRFDSSQAPPQTDTDSGGVMPYSVDGSGCDKLATVTMTSTSVETVTPKADASGGGVCVFSVRDATGASVNVTVEVKKTPLVVTPTALAFADRDAAAQTFSVTGGGLPYTLDFSSCAGLVDVTGSSPGPYTVTPIHDADKGPGTCSIAVMSADQQTGTVSVSVGEGSFTVSPGDMVFYHAGSPPQLFLVTGGQQPYTIDATACTTAPPYGYPTLKSVDEVSPGLYQVTPSPSAQGGATCVISIYSADGQKSSVSVKIISAGGSLVERLAVISAFLTFTSPFAAPQVERVSGGSGHYTIDDSACAGVVTVTGSGGVYTVTPVRSNSSGATCTLAVRAGAFARTVSVAVAPQLAVNPRVLSFTTIHGAPVRVRVTGAQPIALTVSPNCAGALNVTRGPIAGFVQEFLVQLIKTPESSPCTITFTANGQIAPLSVNVRLSHRR